MKILGRKLQQKIDNLPSKHMDHVIAMVRLSDDNGIVRSGYSVKDICFMSNMSMKHHYNCMRYLIAAGIYILDNQGNVMIADNSLKSCVRKGGHGYIEICEFITTKEFQQMNVMSKRYILHLYSTYAKRGKIKTTLATIMTLLHLQRPNDAVAVLNELKQHAVINIDFKNSVCLSKDTVIYISLSEKAKTPSKLVNRSTLTIIRSILKAKKIGRFCASIFDVQALVRSYNRYKQKFMYYLDHLTAETVSSYPDFLFSQLG